MNRPQTRPADWPIPLSAPSNPAEPVARIDEAPLTTLGDMLATVGRRWRPLSVWVMLCLAVAVWYLRVTPPEFTASATVILEPRRQAVVTTDGAAAGYLSTLDSAQAESQIQVIRSERILASVFDLLDLRHAPEFADRGPSLKGRAMAVLGVSPKPGAVDPADAEADARMQAFQAFTDRVAVRRAGQSYVLDVSYRARSAVQAARIANAVTSAYILAQIDQKAASHNSAEYLRGRISDITAEQEAALDGVREGRIPTIQFPDADARIIGAALRPLAKSSPQTALVIVFALSFGALTGLLVVGVNHALDRSLKTRAQVRHALGLECLGIVPDASRLKDLRAARRAGSLGRAVITRPSSRFAHAIRAARIAIMLPFEEKRAHAVGFVSWSHGEGRTTLASNLAHLMAVSGNPVELIDGDFLHPALTGQLAPRSAAGLSEALVGNAGLSRLKTVALSPTLNFLPAAGEGRAGEPNAYLGAPGMVDLLSRLTAERDVVVDLPPLSTSSDAQALCPFLDGVVLVVEAGRTRIDDVLNAMRMLRAANANVLGVVLNKSGAGELKRPRAT